MLSNLFMANLQKYIFQKIFFALWTKIECAEFEPWVLIYSMDPNY